MDQAVVDSDATSDRLSGGSPTDSGGAIATGGRTAGVTRTVEERTAGGVCTFVTTINHTMLTATVRPSEVCAGSNRDWRTTSRMRAISVAWTGFSRSPMRS